MSSAAGELGRQSASTLTDLEARVVCLLYANHCQSEIAVDLGVENRDVERCVRSIRTKM